MHPDRPQPRSRATRPAQFAAAVALTAAAATGTVAGSVVSPWATLPGAAAEPTTSPTAPSTSTSTSTSTSKSTSTTGSSTAAPSSGSAAADTFSLDDSGYVDSAARCDEDQVPVAFGRTSRALVAVCVDRDGQLEYRGVRLSDEASVTVPASRSSDGAIVATNDGVTYAVSPTMLLVSEGDSVIYRDAWIEFREPRFSEDTTSSTTSAPTSSPSTSTAPATTTRTSAAPTTTVTTTTVTVTPSAQPDN